MTDQMDYPEFDMDGSYFIPILPEPTPEEEAQYQADYEAERLLQLGEHDEKGMEQVGTTQQYFGVSPDKLTTLTLGDIIDLLIFVSDGLLLDRTPQDFDELCEIAVIIFNEIRSTQSEGG